MHSTVGHRETYGALVPADVCMFEIQMHEFSEIVLFLSFRFIYLVSGVLGQQVGLFFSLLISTVFPGKHCTHVNLRRAAVLFCLYELTMNSLALLKEARL